LSQCNPKAHILLISEPDILFFENDFE